MPGWTLNIEKTWNSLMCIFCVKIHVSVYQSFQVHAIDPDAGLNGTVIFGLDDQDSGPFQINPFSKLPLDVTPIMEKY